MRLLPAPPKTILQKSGCTPRPAPVHRPSPAPSKRKSTDTHAQNSSSRPADPRATCIRTRFLSRFPLPPPPHARENTSATGSRLPPPTACPPASPGRNRPYTKYQASSAPLRAAPPPPPVQSQPPPLNNQSPSLLTMWNLNLLRLITDYRLLITRSLESCYLIAAICYPQPGRN